ncbi:hypothetical protein TVAG_117090 [Trichomonas vaginalis G3]|uniref:Uncharacterized protein n=1 Tax=Trichomonas vaginalis (strain ATCC PRA-98 / G3) TaxID=412133 RepID=A2E3P9_TRIV3|nr:hypothetical protein TVAGG3_0507750 [Trichomonas vaginalis G3]EAY12687.1 hypothetical protein TVAG_117090 [Trichomonas vaginalis G3]KAI5517551.1 hypothetical protein TVAGG3_0507750 [Trichomonas vaginalis G3]|eukprot:XP_001324910.1 hypothetical protein [Trichomonas vaginalis G3]
MFSFFLTSSLSQQYKIIGIDQDQNRIPYASFNLDTNTKTIRPEKLTTNVFEANQIRVFEIQRPDGQNLTIDAPKFTTTISFNLYTNFQNYPVAFEVTSSSNRKSANEVTIRLKTPSKEYPPHPFVQEQPASGGFPWPLIILGFIILSLCMRNMAPPA